jgi:hypothetical protein
MFEGGFLGMGSFRKFAPYFSFKNLDQQPLPPLAFVERRLQRMIQTFRDLKKIAP